MILSTRFPVAVALAAIIASFIAPLGAQTLIPGAAPPADPLALLKQSEGFAGGLKLPSSQNLDDFEKSLFSNTEAAPRKRPTMPVPTKPTPIARPPAPRPTVTSSLPPSTSLLRTPPPSGIARETLERIRRERDRRLALKADATKAVKAKTERPPKPKRRRRRRAPRSRRAKGKKVKKTPAQLRFFRSLRKLVELQYERRQLLASRHAAPQLLSLDRQMTDLRQQILVLKGEKRKEEAAQKTKRLFSDRGRKRRAQRSKRRDTAGRRPMSANPGLPMMR